MEKKIISWTIAGALIIALGYVAFGPKVNSDYKSIIYEIDGQKIKLENGLSQIPAAPNSASKIITRYFGNELKKDLDGDGRLDTIFLLTQENGGTGIFFYAVAALRQESDYLGSKAFFLGDRIAPQTTGSGNGNIVIINFADRAEGESFANKPTIGKSVYLDFDAQKNEFVDVTAKNDQNKIISATFVCEKELIIKADFNNNEPAKVSLSVSDGRKFELPRAMSGSGARYAMADESIVFWNKGDSAFLEENGTTTIENCITQ